MQRAVLGIALGLLGCLSVACAQPAAAPAPGGPATGGADAPVTPKVKRVVLAVGQPAREYNEMRHLTGPDSWQLRPMYEDLIGIDPATAKLLPQLATDWKVEPDGQSIRFQLRKGVPFQKNLGEFTTKDLTPPWKEMVRQDSLSGARPYWVKTLKSIEVVGPYEAVYRLTEPSGNFFESISEARGSMEPFATAQYEKDGPATMATGPIPGTGPYQFLQRTQGVNVVYEKAPYQHWRQDAQFQEFEFRWLKEASTRLASLITGEVHIADLPEDLKPQAVARGMKLVTGKVPALRTFVDFVCCYVKDVKDLSKGYMNPDAPLLNKTLRRALSKAVDRNALNKAFFGGKGAILHNNDWHPLREGWNPDWEKRFQDIYGYDPDAAKKLLAEAGYGPGKPFSIGVDFQPISGYSGADDMMDAIAGMWRAIGVNTQLQKTDSTDWNNQIRQFKINNVAKVTATNATQWTGATVYSTSIGPRSGYEDIETDTVLNQLQVTMDPKRQDELWRKSGDIKFDSIPNVPLFWLPVEAVYNPTIVADWPFPGSLSGSWSHVYLIKAAR